MPSILQSMSWSPSTRRMSLTFVPAFTASDESFTLRSFHRDRIAVMQLIVIGIAHHVYLVGAFRRGIVRPFMRAFRTGGIWGQHGIS
jgi:hypothetical protein